MRFRLLGVLEAEDGGCPVAISGTKVRSALVVLLLHANEVVSRDVLIDALWGDRPPPTAPHGLDVLVSRLRRQLGAPAATGRLETRPGGYLLRVDEDELDARRFERLLREGRSALARDDLDAAVEALHAALAEWRGSALGDLADEPFAVAESARLDELRFATLEELFGAELRRGRHLEVVAELESLVTTYPLRERARDQLMLALYRSGRQAEALDVYREGRRLLSDELGLEPGQELQRLHAAILRHDPELTVPTFPLRVRGAVPETRYAPAAKSRSPTRSRATGRSTSSTSRPS